MEINEYLEKRKNLQTYLIKFLDEEELIDNNFINLKKHFNDQKIQENKDDLTESLHLLVKISNNHHRSANFFDKIDQILQYLKNDISKHFTQSEIFKIFKSNKRILLFLFKEKIITMDKSIIEYMESKEKQKYQYMDYFNESFKDDNDFEAFEQKRKNGENDNYICQLIRNDAIDDFVSYTSRICLKLTEKIHDSEFETHAFLIKNNPTLIKYTAFFGSIQIFKYLLLNNVDLTPSLWIYAIHGRNPEIIHILEQKSVQPKDKSYNKCLIEAIKCHHNEFANYFITNFISNQKQEFEDDICSQSFKYFNFAFFTNEINNESALYYACCYDYISLVKILIKNPDLNINSLIILMI